MNMLTSVPTEIGEFRAYHLARYNVTHDPADLRELPQEKFDAMHAAARKDWTRAEAKRIAAANGWKSSKIPEAVH
jgi:hypothetical protein